MYNNINTLPYVSPMKFHARMAIEMAKNARIFGNDDGWARKAY
jgi:hypothetical protein